MTEDEDKPNFLKRLYRALGPISGGMVLDLVDFATFGPVGFYLGPIAGGLIGWWIASMHNFSVVPKIVCIILAGAYCMMPITEFLPLATILSVVARLFEREKKEE